MKETILIQDLTQLKVINAERQPTEKRAYLMPTEKALQIALIEQTELRLTIEKELLNQKIQLKNEVEALIYKHIEEINIINNKLSILKNYR